MIRSLPRSLFLIAAATMAAGAQVVHVERGTDIPALWRPDRPLYVKGDLGVSAERLDAFADWLAANAPNWTIVLMRHAHGETFRDATGTTFSGMDAVEHALGTSLPAATGFAEHTHPETAEKNGAYFILYLEEQKLAYHASEAYDNRRLGEDHWIGNLDAAAIAAMRGGGRVIDAAKDTVVTIDRELQRRIRQEAEARARDAERARRASEETAAAIVEARQRLTDLEARVLSLRRDFNNPAGDLANPPLVRWAARLDAAERALAQADPEAAAITRDATGEIVRHIRALADHEDAPARIRGLEQQLDEVRLHDSSAGGRTALLGAREHLRAAGDAHARADAVYADSLAAAEAGLAATLRADTATRRQVAEVARLAGRAATAGSPEDVMEAINQAKIGLDEGSDISRQLDQAEARLRRAEAARQHAIQRRQMRHAGLITGGLLLGCGLVATGVMGNRRRRGPRSRAIGLFDTWETTLRERSGGLFELLDRTSKAIGTAADLERSGWTGETLRLSRQTLADVDHLFILASGIDRVLDQVRGLLFPQRAAAKSINRFSSKRYDKALELLESQPIRFSPDDPLRTILSGRQTAAWHGLVGQTKDEAPFTHTFVELHEIFRERAARALAALDILDHCWTGSQQALTALDAAITDAETRERAGYDAATPDGLFAIPAVFGQLIPAARDDHEAATHLAASDPVTALRDALPRGARRAADALALCGVAAEFRSQWMPAIDKERSHLAGRRRRIGWIEAAIDALSSRADELAETAVEQPITEDLKILAADAGRLVETVREASRLEERAHASCIPAITEARERVGRERQRLGRLVGLPADQLLREGPALDPDAALEQAARQHAAALIDLDLGCIEAATAALDDCDQHCRFIHEMIEATLAAYEAAPAASADLEREGRRIHALLPAATALTEELRHSWAPSALRPASADPSHPDPAASVTDHLQRAESALQAAGEAMAMAVESHRSGRILQAADLRDQAAAAQAAAEQTLRGIHEHAAAIAAAVTANTSRLGKLDHQSQHLDRAASDPQITRPAMGEWAAARDLLETARTAVDARGPSANPFESARLLDATDAALTAIEARFTADRHLHEEVARSLDAADQEMNAARRLVHRSQTDQIPDSGETTRCVNRLTELESELAETRRLFALPHGDWQRLDQEADRITAEAARLGGRLRGELELAEQAVQAIHAAHAKVRAASAWRGDSGASALQRARAGLSGGDYHGARELAASAARLADQAVRAIEAEALMRLRQVQRQHEAARRRTRTSSFGTSSGFGSRSGGSGFSSRSSFSSRSGGSRSSFSSGSGTRRSGW